MIFAGLYPLVLLGFTSTKRIPTIVPTFTLRSELSIEDLPPTAQMSPSLIFTGGSIGALLSSSSWNSPTRQRIAQIIKGDDK
jgi:hypothetical protein